MRAFPAVVPAEMPSTATQNDADGQDTDWRALPLSMLIALDHVPPAADDEADAVELEWGAVDKEEGGVEAPGARLALLALPPQALVSAAARTQAIAVAARRPRPVAASEPWALRAMSPPISGLGTRGELASPSYAVEP